MKKTRRAATQSGLFHHSSLITHHFIFRRCSISGFRGRGPRQQQQRGPQVRINERIRVPQIRVIGSDGSQLGIMHPREALRIAQSEGLDLVEVATTANPPVCRIIDYGKFQYEAKKKAHEAKKNQVTVTVKEIKFRPGTDDHDYDYRVKHARDWLMDGDKVRATIFFRGREMSHRELGAKILEKVEKELSDIAETEVRPKMEGNQMFIIMTPKRQKIAAAKAEAKPKPEKPPAPPEKKPA